jgi:sec-independent protein translocase protein TatC
LKVYLDGQTHAVQLASQSLIVPLIEISSYLSFVAFTSLGVVVAFQLPVVMQVLGWTGLIDPELLARYRRHCIFACFALGMVLTPPDVISMLLFSFPLWGLFELGLFVMRRAYRTRRTTPG